MPKRLIIATVLRHVITQKSHNMFRRGGILSLETSLSVCSFGVVCAFVTNEYMEDGTKKLPSRLRTSIGDTKLYLSNTQAVSMCLV